MTGLIIFLSIILFFVLLFISSITVYVNYSDELSVKIGFLGIKFYDLFSDEEKDEDEDKNIISDKKTPHTKDEKSITEDEKAPSKENEEKNPNPPNPTKGETLKKNDFSETVTLVLEVIKTTFPKIKNMLLKIRITAVNIDMKVGQEDAYDTAMSYSYYSMGVYQTIAVLKSNIIVKIKKISITPDFTNHEVVSNISFKVKIRLYVILFGIVGILVNIIKNKEIMKRWRKK